MTLTKKAMILFDPQKYKKLEKEAKRRHTSVGELVREAVEVAILAKQEPAKQKRLAAARRLIFAEEKVPEWEEIEKIIARGHTE